MPYTNCAVCGAKALVGATRCPRCQAPFVSYDPKGERVPTVNCPNCGVQRPVAIGVCPNCLISTAPSGARLMRGLVLAGLAIIAVLAIGYMMSRDVKKSAETPRPPMSVKDTAQPRDSAQGDSSAAATGISSQVTTQPMVSASPAKSDSVNPTGFRAATPARRLIVPFSDTGQWEFAFATTWVRVRAGPSRESAVLRMIDSAQRVRLGPPSQGWRPVRVGVDRGWIDPRYFVLQSTPRP